MALGFSRRAQLGFTVVSLSLRLEFSPVLKTVQEFVNTVVFSGK